MPEIRRRSMKEYPLLEPDAGLPLFYPSMSDEAELEVSRTLKTRWIGQGPKVDLFEKTFGNFIGAEGRCIAVNSGTSALHLAYVLAGVGADTKVLSPLFTCTATNLPIIYLGGTPVFCDVGKGSLNIDVDCIEQMIDDKTIAISVVDYGGVPNDYKRLRDICDAYNLFLIADLAHAVDGTFDGLPVHTYADFSCYSFQAIKTLTCGDGGCLVVRDQRLVDKARRLRWFGIDRVSKQRGIWENDIKEIGYKFQMNDVSASIGLANLSRLKDFIELRRQIFKAYIDEFGKVLAQNIIENTVDSKISFTPWIITLLCQGQRNKLMQYLRFNSIESAQVHYRNDRYSIFTEYVGEKIFHNMDAIEHDYLVLPLHTNMTIYDAKKVAKTIKLFYNN